MQEISSDLIQLVNAGGNVALLACVYYIINAVRVLTRLEKGIDALLYRIGFQMDLNGDVSPVSRKRSGE